MTKNIQKYVSTCDIRKNIAFCKTLTFSPLVCSCAASVGKVLRLSIFSGGWMDHEETPSDPILQVRLHVVSMLPRLGADSAEKGL